MLLLSWTDWGKLLYVLNVECAFNTMARETVVASVRPRLDHEQLVPEQEKQTPAKQAWSRPKGFPAKSTTSQSVTVFPLPCARSQIDQIKRVKKKTKLTTCYPFAVFIVHHVLDKCTRMINTTVSHSNNDSKRKPQTSRALQSKPSGRIHLYSVKQQDLNNVGHLQTLTAWKFMKLLCITQTRNPTGAQTKHSSNNQNRFNNWTTL